MQWAVWHANLEKSRLAVWVSENTFLSRKFRQNISDETAPKADHHQSHPTSLPSNASSADPFNPYRLAGEAGTRLNDSFSYEWQPDAKPNNLNEIPDLQLPRTSIDPTLFGGRRTEPLVGRDRNDLLFGSNRNDMILALLGDDRIFGGKGDDVLFGGAGNDSVFGGAGRDKLVGGTGDDLISGGTSADSLFGGQGNDLLKGEDGDDLISGGAGSDTLLGGSGSDTLDGERGNDVFVLADSDSAFGGDGSDIFTFDQTLGHLVGAISVFGGEGDEASAITVGLKPTTLFGDWIDLRGLGPVSITESGTESGIVTFIGAGGETLTVVYQEIEGILQDVRGNGLVEGTSNADDMAVGFSDPQGDAIDGTDGANDIITSGEGDDTVDAGVGQDSVQGGTGNDRLLGGSGNDTISGDIGNDSIYGGDGSDRLDGDGGTDSLFGGIGDDFLRGGSGTNDLFGEDGDDTLVGGDDRASGTSFGGFLYGGSGHDWLTGGVQVHDSAATLDGGLGNDTLSAGVNMTAYGGDGDDIITVAPGAVAPFARFTGQGDGGQDSLTGSQNQDYLYGGTGNDTLDGNGGKDRLWGGAGADIFRLDSLDDFFIWIPGSFNQIELKIMDFEAGLDRIDLSGLGLKYVSPNDATGAAGEAFISNGLLLVTARFDGQFGYYGVGLSHMNGQPVVEPGADSFIF